MKNTLRKLFNWVFEPTNTNRLSMIILWALSFSFGELINVSMLFGYAAVLILLIWLIDE